MPAKGEPVSSAAGRRGEAPERAAPVKRHEVAGEADRGAEGAERHEQAGEPRGRHAASTGARRRDPGRRGAPGDLLARELGEVEVGLHETRPRRPANRALVRWTTAAAAAAAGEDASGERRAHRPPPRATARRAAARARPDVDDVALEPDRGAGSAPRGEPQRDGAPRPAARLRAGCPRPPSGSSWRPGRARRRAARGGAAAAARRTRG